MEILIIFLYVIPALVLVVVGVWLASLFFQVKKQVELNKIQVKLLYTLAAKAGVDKEALNALVNHDAGLVVAADK